MKKLLMAAALAFCAYGQNGLDVTFSTAPGGGHVNFETTETLDTAATRACSASTVVVTRTSSTVLSVGNSASSSAIQFVRLNPKTRFVTAAVTLTLTAGTGTGSVDIYGQLKPDGTLQFVAYNKSSNTLAWGSGNSIVNAPNPTPAGVLLYSWTITTGAWDVSGGTDQQPNTECWIDQIVLSNTTAGAITVTITDSQSTPLNTYKAVSVAANATVIIALPGGKYFDGGMKINASAANSIDAEWRGVRRPQSQSNP